MQPNVDVHNNIVVRRGKQPPVFSAKTKDRQENYWDLWVSLGHLARGLEGPKMSRQKFLGSKIVLR